MRCAICGKQTSGGLVIDRECLDKLRRELAAAVADLTEICNRNEKNICGQICKHMANECFVPVTNGGRYECANFEWRGVAGEGRQ